MLTGDRRRVERARSNGAPADRDELRGVREGHGFSAVPGEAGEPGAGGRGAVGRLHEHHGLLGTLRASLGDGSGVQPGVRLQELDPHQPVIAKDHTHAPLHMHPHSHHVAKPAQNPAGIGPEP